MSKTSKQEKLDPIAMRKFSGPKSGDAAVQSIEMALIAEYLSKTFPRIIVALKAKAQ
jgi:hypothetical protein